MGAYLAREISGTIPAKAETHIIECKFHVCIGVSSLYSIYYVIMMPVSFERITYIKTKFIEAISMESIMSTHKCRNTIVSLNQ